MSDSHCGICYKRVNCNHKAIQCDNCNCWIHIKCNYVTPAQYENMIDSNESWICKNCYPNTFACTTLDNEEFKLFFQGKNLEIDLLQNHKPNDIADTTFYKNMNNLEMDRADDIEINCEYYTLSDLNSKPFKQSQFSVAHLNIASMNGHFDKLSNLLNLINLKFDIVGISETKILKHLPQHQNYDLEDYVMEHCPTEAEKGGTAIFISNMLDYKKRNDLLIYKPHLLESIFIETQNPTDKKNSIIGVIYRHPSMSVKEFNETYLEELLNKINKENKNFILLGDYNIDLLNCNVNTDTSVFLDNMCAASLIPAITKPTRITTHSKTLIDNIFNNIIETLTI